MSGSETGNLALRVERGRASDEELAVVVAVLHAVLAGRGESDGDREASEVPRWRPELAAQTYRSPYHWR
ncbi:acyl-CoA carboxylase epsilon subunit [Kitasatospora sp. LaBMicrA B282]|uniref:acyl-CoA carboxylase epsilon subunit n=1 Tax=Kitasatospora sp. LaBMicrA B282 TaxID=3420949 RepID=UPI003D12F728